MNLSSITRRAIESAVCAVLAGGTLAGIAAAGTVAPTATAATVAPVARVSTNYGPGCGELAPGDDLPRTCVMTVTAAGELRPVPRRRIALRWLAAHLPACEYEDSRDCVWNARTSGNGRGDSFVDIAGTAYYFRPAAGGAQ